MNKEHPNQKEVKVPLFADDMILYVENPKGCTEKLLELLSKFNKIGRIKVQQAKMYSVVICEQGDR